MTEAMRTSGVRLASLFHEVGLIKEPEWKKYFKENSEQRKRFVDILFQDVSWQTFVDLASLEIRLPTGSRKTAKRLPVELTQAIHIHRDEVLELLEEYRPDVKPLCSLIAKSHKAISPAIDKLLGEMEEGDGDPYRELLERGILTPEILSECVQEGAGPAAQRNRRLLAIEILRLNELVSADLYEALLEAVGEPTADLAKEMARHGNDWSRRIAKAAAAGMALPTVDVAGLEIDEQCRNFCPVGLLRREMFLPIEVGEIVRLAMSDPLNLSVPDLLALLTGRMVLPCYAAPNDVIGAINRIFPAKAAEPAEARKPERRETAEPPAAAAAKPVPEAPAKSAAPRPAASVAKIMDSMSAVQVVSSMIESAVATKSTDIHLEPNPQGMRVRYRIDGQLHTVMNIPSDTALPVISRIKVLANMNVTERRRPQDGHFELEMGGRNIDFRVSAMPSHLGEKLVLRILDQSTVLKGLSELGLNGEQEKILSHLIDRPYGLLLVTGPTGGGKTTTLYSALNTINRPEINITTIEDPVEYQLEGITQVQVDYAMDLTFAGGLRAALRQDPDVIMVGEVRDPETARIAIRAALTGHLVFSTLHTNAAVGAVAALTHMGVQPYLIASALAGVVAQRLVRRICDGCRQPIRVTKGLRRDLGLDEKSRYKMYRGKGCSACLDTGYTGRTGIFEILSVNDAIRRLIIEQAGDEAILEVARNHGFCSLREHAMEKLFEGITSPDEIMRVVFLSD